jgi:UDP-N-acetylmuramate--alanine ligase
MTMGAGDIWRVAHMLKEELQKERVNE